MASDSKRHAIDALDLHMNACRMFHLIPMSGTIWEQTGENYSSTNSKQQILSLSNKWIKNKSPKSDAS